MKNIYNVVVTANSGSKVNKVVKASSFLAVERKYKDTLVSVELSDTIKNYTHKDLVLKKFYKKEFLNLLGKYKTLLRIPADAKASHGEDWGFDESLTLEFPVGELLFTLSTKNSSQITQMMSDFEKLGAFKIEPDGSGSYLYFFGAHGNGIFAKDPWVS